MALLTKKSLGSSLIFVLASLALNGSASKPIFGQETKPATGFDFKQTLDKLRDRINPKKPQYLRDNPYLRRLLEGQESDPNERYLRLKAKVEETFTRVMPQYPYQLTPATPTFQSVADLTTLNSEGVPYIIRRHERLPILFIGQDAYGAGLAFDRLYVFVEAKPGVLLNDEDLDHYTETHPDAFGTNTGNDYRLTEVARFYTEARKHSLKLNSMEVRLREELLRDHLLTEADGAFQAKGEAAIIEYITNYATMPERDASTADITARSTLEHEFNHGIYFTDPAYRNAVARFWRSLSQEDQIFAKTLLSAVFDETYDFGHDSDLFLREFVAHLRDPNHLIEFYVNSMGKEILASDKAPHAKAKSYFSPDGHLKANSEKQLRDLSQRLLSLDGYSVAYRDNAKRALEQGLSSLKEKLRQLGELFHIPTDCHSAR